MKIYSSIEQAIGKTPLVELKNIEKKYNLKCHLLAKAEFINPAGSIKDRTALFMLEDAISKGLVNENSTIIEPTSGNTGIGLAMLAAVRGYKVIIVMPDTMSVERQKLIKAYGAEVVLTDGKLGMKGSIDKANELSASIPDSFIPGQFDNPSNADAHFKTTGPEIWEDTDGQVDYFVATAGTGGTISGTGKFLKSKNPNIKVIAVEPASSPLLSKGYSGQHKIEGIGANFVPKIMDTKLFDEIIAVTNEDAFEFCRELAAKEGMLSGISSGAALKAALEIAEREESSGKNIVLILPDSGSRYMSTEAFA